MDFQVEGKQAHKYITKNRFKTLNDRKNNRSRRHRSCIVLRN